MDRYLVGQPVRITWTVRDTTGALVNPAAQTLTLLKPDGSSGTYPSPGTTGTGSFFQDLAASPDLALSGYYQWKVVSTGSGAGVVTGSFQVVDAFTLPDLEVWRPSRTQVAKYVPERTLPADQLSDIPVGDFTTLTTPTAAQADSHIDDAQSYVALRTGTLDPGMYPDASAVVALRAAGMIEMSYPVRDGDINTAQALLAQADLMLERLVLANEAANPGTSAPGVLSAWQFPESVPWGDRLEIF